MRMFRFLPALFLALSPLTALAASRTLGGLSETGSAAGFGAQPVPFTTFIANGINAILGLAGLFFLGALVYAGIQYLTSGGDHEKVKNAKGLIVSSIIGIVIIATAFAINTFVIEQIRAGLEPSAAPAPQVVPENGLNGIPGGA